MKRMIMVFAAFLLSAVLSASVYAATVTDEKALTVPQGGKESIMVDISDNGAIKYDMTIDASEGDIIVYSPKGTALDTLHFTSADMPVHRYVPVSQGSYTIEISRPSSSSGSGSVTASLEYEGNSSSALYDTVDSIVAAIGFGLLLIVSIALSIFFRVNRFRRALGFFTTRGTVNNVTLFRDDFDHRRWPF